MERIHPNLIALAKKHKWSEFFREIPRVWPLSQTQESALLKAVAMMLLEVGESGECANCGLTHSGIHITLEPGLCLTSSVPMELVLETFRWVREIDSSRFLAAIFRGPKDMHLTSRQLGLVRLKILELLG